MDLKKMTGRHLSAIVRLTHAQLNKEMEKLGLSSQQAPFFLATMKTEGARQEDISEFLFMDKATTARAIKKLEEMGLVKRINCSKDHRCFRVYTTEKGKKLVPGIIGILMKWNDVLFKGFTEEEQEIFATQLLRVLENVKTATGR